VRGAGGWTYGVPEAKAALDLSARVLDGGERLFDALERGVLCVLGVFGLALGLGYGQPLVISDSRIEVCLCEDAKAGIGVGLEGQ